MTKKAWLFHIFVFVITLILGGFLLSIPARVKSDGLITTFTALQHKGIYLNQPYILDEITLMPKDRINRIDGCTIETYLKDDCATFPNAEQFSYELIRAGQRIDFTSEKNQPISAQIQGRYPAIGGILVMLLCGLLLLINLNKVRWYRHLLVIFCLFSLIFVFEAIQFPISLVTTPNLFWFYLTAFLLTHTSLRAALLNLLLLYPQYRFGQKRTRQVILWINLIIPPIFISAMAWKSNDPISGIHLAYDWLTGYSVLMFFLILLTLFYHFRHGSNPITNLRLRWIRIGVISIGILVTGIVISLIPLATSGVFQSLVTADNTILSILSHPLLLLILFCPVFYAIPLSERFPRKIDNLENRVLFHVLLGIVVLIGYVIAVLFFFRFQVDPLIQQPLVFVGLALTAATVLVLALLRNPINQLINRWFYRDRLKYQSLLPGFLLQLSSNLNYPELIDLLLEKFPADFGITGTDLILREPGGETYSLITQEEDTLQEQFSKNHPLIQHCAINRKPILRFLDQNLLHPGISSFMAKFRFEAAIPLMHLGSLVGILFLKEKGNGKPYTISELNVLAEMADWAGSAVYNTWVVREKEKYSRSLEYEMEQQSQELHRVVNETRQYHRHFQEKSQQRESILEQVHQDLRTPMNDIAILNTLLSQENETVSQDQLTALSQKITLLGSRLDTFLEYALVQNDNYQPVSSVCDLSYLCRMVLNSLQNHIPNIEERISFHIDANTPMIVNMDGEHVQQILTMLIQITLQTHPGLAFVISCVLDPMNNESPAKEPRLSFVCKAQKDAIVVQKSEIQTDQIRLKLELVDQLLQRMHGELRRHPRNSDENFPFHFSLQIDLPPNSYPAYLGVDLPFLSGRSLAIYEGNAELLQQRTLHASSWGMEVTAISSPDQWKNFLSQADKPGLIFINANTTDWEDGDSHIDPSTRIIVDHSGPEEVNPAGGEKPIPGFQPAQFYNLITRALLFTTIAEAYPHLPRNLELDPSVIAAGKTVLLVGETENSVNLTKYFTRFQLTTIQYEGDLDTFNEYLDAHEIDILIFEMVSKKRKEWDILQEIRQAEIPQPFIIATSANPIRFPALETLKSGADKYLLKPYQLSDILKLVAEWLNHQSESRTESS